MPKVVFAIDPGTEQSAYLELDRGRVASFGILSNKDMCEPLWFNRSRGSVLRIEMVASYGMPVGREVFETCVWIGRFIEAARMPWEYVYRKDVKLHLCGNLRAKDAHVRQALIDRFGPGKEKAIGRKAAPGPLYGVSSHVWSALAVAVYSHDNP